MSPSSVMTVVERLIEGGGTLMRIIAIASVICCSLVSLAVAADAHAAIKKPTNIPAQALEPALQTLAKQRDLQLVYRSDVVGELRTGGATGELTAQEALQQLLGGTGLTLQYLDDKTVTIVASSAMEAAHSSARVTSGSNAAHGSTSATSTETSPRGGSIWN